MQICKLSWIQDSRFKILGETSWIQAWFWIQEVFLRILNLESPKNCKFANFPGFKIQDSGGTPWIQALFWIQEVFLRILNLESQKKCKFASGGNSLNPGLVLDSRSFSQNLEFWILNPKKNANFAGFKIRDSRFWEKLPESRPWLNKRYVRGIVVCSGSIKWYIN